jgi:hypothetical protein
MNFKNIAIFFLIIFSQCSLFEPRINTVPDSLVQDELLNLDQKTKIIRLNDSIVLFRKDIISQKNTNEINAHSIRISKKKILNQISTTELLKEKEKLEIVKESYETAKRYSSETKISDSEKGKEEARLKSWIQKEKLDDAYYQLLEAKLSEEITKLELERAGIAVAFQDSQGTSHEDKNFINKEKFNTQYLKTVADTEKKQIEYDRQKTEFAKLPKADLEKTYLDDKIEQP